VAVAEPNTGALQLTLTLLVGPFVGLTGPVNVQAIGNANGPLAVDQTVI
jgi:hypothetical protein